LQERYERFMALAGQISTRRLAAQVGRKLRVLVDRMEGGSAIARGPGDAPEIDGVVRFAADSGVKIGEFAEVEITGADTYDLEARLLRSSIRH
jgi:ribosomal protein S12 methylthiotransferase